MKILLLSCSTGEGHNHCAYAVKEALDRRGHKTEFLDALHMFGEPGPLSIENVLNKISAKTPEVFGLIYKAGEMYSQTKATSPIYMANSLRAKALKAFIVEHGYDAVVCSHLFPMETLTYIRRHFEFDIKCYGILSDYTCIPFFAETELNGYMLPHADVLDECLNAGMPGEKLFITGMPVSERFSEKKHSRAEARKNTGLPADKKIYTIMTGGIGCGDALKLCATIKKIPDENALICILAGRNVELIDSIRKKYEGDESVLAVEFTSMVSDYMSAADVLLSKAGGISSSEAAVLNVPLVHTMAIPGVETLNASFFHRHGMSYFAKNEDEAARYADRLIYDKSAAERMLAAQRREAPSDGADRIAEIIENDAVKR